MAMVNPFQRETAEWYRAQAMNEIATVTIEGNDTPPRRDAYARALIYATLAIGAPAQKREFWQDADVRG